MQLHKHVHANHQRRVRYDKPQKLLESKLFSSRSRRGRQRLAVPVKAPSKWDESFDFVIIGAGGAGLSAACHAAEAGLKVLVLEK